MWMFEHLGTMIRRFKVGQDGRTAYEKVKGSQSRRTIVPFGERVWWRPLRAKSEVSTLEPRVQEGCCLRIRANSDEVLIGTRQGVVKRRDFRRRPESERWDKELSWVCQRRRWNPIPDQVT